MIPAKSAVSGLLETTKRHKLIAMIVVVSLALLIPARALAERLFSVADQTSPSSVAQTTENAEVSAGTKMSAVLSSFSSTEPSSEAEQDQGSEATVAISRSVDGSAEVEVEVNGETVETVESNEQVIVSDDGRIELEIEISNSTSGNQSSDSNTEISIESESTSTGTEIDIDIDNNDRRGAPRRTGR